MSATNILGLLGGLALFLYGMQMMSSGLESAAGNKMKEILERLTSNRFLGVIVGAAITAVIQSSSATTVMVVGFVNAGMIVLKSGSMDHHGWQTSVTTITGQLIALDVGAIAPIFAFLGVALIMFVKKTKDTVCRRNHCWSWCVVYRYEYDGRRYDPIKRLSAVY